MRSKDSAHSLRRERNELLCAVPNWWKSSRGPRFVAAVGIGLAAHARGTRSPQAPLLQLTFPYAWMAALEGFEFLERARPVRSQQPDRKSTRLNSSHVAISY